MAMAFVDLEDANKTSNGATLRLERIGGLHICCGC